MLKNEAKERAKIIDDEELPKGRKRRKWARRSRGVLKHDKIESGIPLPGRVLGGHSKWRQKLIKSMKVGQSVFIHAPSAGKMHGFYGAAKEVKAGVAFRTCRKGHRKGYRMWRIK